MTVAIILEAAAKAETWSSDVGRSGTGIFQCDEAQDLLEEMTEVPRKEILAFLQAEQHDVEELDCIMACVGIHTALIRNCGATALSPEDTERLATEILSTYDEKIIGLTTDEEFIAAHRAVIADALADYQRASVDQR